MVSGKVGWLLCFLMCGLILLSYVAKSLTMDWESLFHQKLFLTMFQSYNDSVPNISCELKAQHLHPKFLWFPSWCLSPSAPDVLLIKILCKIYLSPTQGFTNSALPYILAFLITKALLGLLNSSEWVRL